MNVLALLKTLPALGIALYAVSKNFSSPKSRLPSAREMTDALPSEIRGTVQDVMRDARHYYALIDTGRSWSWVGASDGEPAIGDEVVCRPMRFVKHVENSQLRMILEGVYYTDRFELV